MKNRLSLILLTLALAGFAASTANRLFCTVRLSRADIALQLSKV